MDDVIEFTVEGLPPIKNEALSLFSPTHKHHRAVTALREAARRALPRTFEAWTGPLALDVMISGEPLGDATNYLGGIGDVLQVRRSNLDPTDFGVFLDDKQLREINYSVEPAARNGYRVRIRRLAAAAR